MVAPRVFVNCSCPFTTEAVALPIVTVAPVGTITPSENTYVTPLAAPGRTTPLFKVTGVVVLVKQTTLLVAEPLTDAMLAVVILVSELVCVQPPGGTGPVSVMLMGGLVGAAPVVT
jgi:hypothetical protein